MYYHRLGSSEEEDVLFFESPENPKWLYGTEVSQDGETLLLTAGDSCDPVNRLFYFDLRGFDGKDIGTIGTWPWPGDPPPALLPSVSSALRAAVCCLSKCFSEPPSLSCQADHREGPSSG